MSDANETPKSRMKPEQVVEALEAAAGQLDVRVRYESLVASGVTGGGGLCKVRGEWWVVMEKKTTPSERISILSDALSGFDHAALDLPSRVRELLDARRALRGPGSQTVPA